MKPKRKKMEIIGALAVVSIFAQFCGGSDGGSNGEDLESACGAMQFMVRSTPQTMDEQDALLKTLNPRNASIIARSKPNPLSTDQQAQRRLQAVCRDDYAAFWAMDSRLRTDELNAEAQAARDQNQTETPRNSQPSPGKPAFGTQRVSRQDFGEAWPLTVESGIVTCSREGAKIIATFLSDADDREYALNGAATSQGWPPIDRIWRDDPSSTAASAGLKIPIGPLITAALNICSIP
jgi:hypothetical protein